MPTPMDQVRALRAVDVAERRVPVIARPAEHDVGAADPAWKEHPIAVEWQERVVELRELVEVRGPAQTDGGPVPVVAVAPADLKASCLGVLFVTHDLSLGSYISDHTIILRKGRIVERGPTIAVFDRPVHPYTQMLLASVPALHDARDQEHWRDAAAAREAGSCIYHQHYPVGDATAAASEENPTMVEVAPGHLVTCATVDEDDGCLQGTARLKAN